MRYLQIVDRATSCIMIYCDCGAVFQSRANGSVYIKGLRTITIYSKDPCPGCGETIHSIESKYDKKQDVMQELIADANELELTEKEFFTVEDFKL